MRHDRLRQAAAALLAMLLLPLVALAHGGAIHAYEYAVTFDARDIGTHRFEIQHDGRQKRVRSVANFQVRILFLSLYRYHHEAEEFWQDGCLRRLASQTDDNGKRFEVTAADSGTTLYVNRMAPDPAASRVADTCPASFAYWDLEQLQRDTLINSQTGALTSVQFAHLGPDPVDGVPAQRYRLQPQDLDAIDLWYREADGVWLQLETKRDNGTLRYRLRHHERVDSAAMEGAAVL